MNLCFLLQGSPSHCGKVDTQVKGLFLLLRIGISLSIPKLVSWPRGIFQYVLYSCGKNICCKKSWRFVLFTLLPKRLAAKFILWEQKKKTHLTYISSLNWKLTLSFIKDRFSLRKEEILQKLRWQMQ